MKKRFHVTREGIFFFITTFLFLFCAVATGFNLFYIFASFHLSMLILTGVFAGANLTSLEVELPSRFHLWAHQMGELQVKVKNKRRFPLFALNFRLCFQKGQEISFQLPFLAGKGEKVLKVKGKLPRGYYCCQKLVVTSLFPFGILEALREISLEGELWVYPATYALKPRKLEALQLSLSQGGGSEQEFHSLREYTPSDSAKYIHWKASARHQTLLVKKYETGFPARLHLFLQQVPGREEDVLSFGASLAFALFQKRVKIFLHLLDTKGREFDFFSSSSSSLHRLFSFFAEIEWKAGQREPRVEGVSLGVGKREHLAFVSFFFSPYVISTWLDYRQPICF